MVKCITGKAGGAKQDSDALSNTLRADVMAKSVGFIGTSAERINNSQRRPHLSPTKAPQG